MTRPRGVALWLYAALIACGTGPRPRSSERGANAPKDKSPLAVVVDTDGDGIPDERDACPREAEDKDGFEDTVGCPDLDNDHDRILDAADKCPNEAESYNGDDDDDGCPDYATVHARPDIRSTEISFERGRAVTEAGSLSIVDALAVLINDQCLVVEVQGHASRDERRPEALGAARAEAVRAALIARGVPPERMQVRSLGAAEPPCREATDPCRAHNRRVQLVVLDSRVCK